LDFIEEDSCFTIGCFAERDDADFIRIARDTPAFMPGRQSASRDSVTCFPLPFYDLRIEVSDIHVKSMTPNF
jgi:hypothetical protein